MRILRQHRGLGRKHLGYSDILIAVDDLALQVCVLHHVVVDDPDGPDPGCGKVLQCRRTEPASPNHEDLGVPKRLLPRSANFAQHDMAGIALKLAGRKLVAARCGFRLRLLLVQRA